MADVMRIRHVLDNLNADQQTDLAMNEIAYETIKEALEKQIPKKWEPATTEIGMTSGKKLKLSDHICPVCGYSLAVYAPYCECCGQAIDWSVEYNGKIL